MRVWRSAEQPTLETVPAIGDPMLRITGGRVYDPANGIDGVVKDVCVVDGRVVSAVKGGRSIDASGRVVLPGGVDIHSHVAGAALSVARVLTPDNYRTALNR